MKPSTIASAILNLEDVTKFGGKFYIVATRAEYDHLPPGERGDDHHFFRPSGDFVEVTGQENGYFIGKWVHGLTIGASNNVPRRFPRDSARPLRGNKELRALIHSLVTTQDEALLIGIANAG